MRYLNQLLTDFAEIRLRRCGELAAKHLLHVREHTLGYRCNFAGAGGENAKAIYLEARANVQRALQENPQPEDEDQDMRDLNAFMRGPDQAMPTLAQRIGIDLPALPPADVLSDEQLAALNAELVPTLAIHGATYAGPKDYPPRLKFALLMELAQRRMNIIDNGGYMYDGCSGTQLGCQWGMYCPCLQYIRKEDFLAKGGEAGYPDERFYQGDGDPYDFPLPTEEELAEQAKFQALPFEEQERIWEEKHKDDPPCPMHGEECGKW